MTDRATSTLESVIALRWALEDAIDNLRYHDVPDAIRIQIGALGLLLGEDEIQTDHLVRRLGEERAPVIEALTVLRSHGLADCGVDALQNAVFWWATDTAINSLDAGDPNAIAARAVGLVQSVTPTPYPASPILAPANDQAEGAAPPKGAA